MVEVIIKNKVNNLEAYLPLAKNFASDSCCDAGCLGMNVLIQPEDHEHVIFVSQWECKSDFEAHCNGSTFKRHIPLMSQYYEGGTDCIYEVVQ